MLGRRKKLIRLRVETLESRNLMAGDVQAYVADGVLRVYGDNADNSVVLKQVGSRWSVQGIDTTVNGSDAPQTFNGFQFGIRVFLAGGNDSIAVTKGKLGPAGSFEIDSGDGSINVSVKKLKANYLFVRTGDSSDTINIANCRLNDGLGIQTFHSNSDAADTVTVLNTTAKTGLSIGTGGGNDVVRVQGVNLPQGGSLLQTDSAGDNGDDTLSVSKFRSKELLEIRTGDGADDITLDSVQSKSSYVDILATAAASDTSVDIVRGNKISAAQRLRVATGDGADQITLTKCTAKEMLEVSTAGTTVDEGDTVVLKQLKGGTGIKVTTGSGADNITLAQSSSAATIEINSGDDADIVSISQATADGLRVDLGSGEDEQLSIVRSSGRSASALANENEDDEDKVTYKRNRWKSGQLNIIGFELKVQ